MNNKVPVTLPELWNLPYHHNLYFTGREEVLVQLNTLLKTGQAGVPVALSGMGGIGKTQTAVEYAYRYHNEYKAVFGYEPIPVKRLSQTIFLSQHLSISRKKSVRIKPWRSLPFYAGCKLIVNGY